MLEACYSACLWPAHRKSLPGAKGHLHLIPVFPYVLMFLLSAHMYGSPGWQESCTGGMGPLSCPQRHVAGGGGGDTVPSPCFPQSPG